MWTGAQALDLGLVDALGDLRDAALAWCRELVTSGAGRRASSELEVAELPAGVLGDVQRRLAGGLQEDALKRGAYLVRRPESGESRLQLAADGASHFSRLLQTGLEEVLA